jgi:hypothetical protein
MEVRIVPYFQQIELTPLDNPVRLDFGGLIDGAGLNPEQLTLLKDIKNAEARIGSAFQIKSSFKNLNKEVDNIRKELLEQLKRIAEIGLGASADVPLAQVEFEAFKSSVENAAMLIRKNFLRVTSQLNVPIMLFGIVVAIVLNLELFGFYGWLSSLSLPPSLLNAFQIGFFALFGIGIGNMFVAFVTGRELRWDNFDRLNRYKYTVLQQLSLVLIICASLFILLGFDIIQLGVGGVLLNDLDENPAKLHYGILVGFISSISEAVIVNLISDSSKPAVTTSNS